MTLITFQDGKPVLRDGKVGVESSCCCNGDCLCCSCVSRVVYTPSEPGADAQPFAGIAPEGGSWQWDGSQYYGEFPCHYVEYAFSEYAASIFPNAVNAGADAAYSGGGTWTKRSIPNGYVYTSGETRCTGSTEADCQPCLAYPGTTPSGSPLPTLEQLRKQCGIYHPCTQCERCSTGDGCGAPGTNLSQDNGDTYPIGIPWPPPDGTCPCRPCDLLCLQEMTVTWQSKIRTVVIDGRHWPDCDGGPYWERPVTFKALSEFTLPTNTILIAGGTLYDGSVYGESPWWDCNTEEKREIRYPVEIDIPNLPPEWTSYPPCPDWGYEPPSEESEWWEVECTFFGRYWVLRTVPEDGGACGDTGIVRAYGGINEIAAAGFLGSEAYWLLTSPPPECEFSYACGIACWSNPFP